MSHHSAFALGLIQVWMLEQRHERDVIKGISLKISQEGKNKPELITRHRQSSEYQGPTTTSRTNPWKGL